MDLSLPPHFELPDDDPASEDSSVFWADRCLGDNLSLYRFGILYIVDQREPDRRVRAFWTAAGAVAFANRRFHESREEVFLTCLYPY